MVRPWRAVVARTPGASVCSAPAGARLRKCLRAPSPLAGRGDAVALGTGGRGPLHSRTRITGKATSWPDSSKSCLPIGITERVHAMAEDDGLFLNLTLAPPAAGQDTTGGAGQKKKLWLERRKEKVRVLITALFWFMIQVVSPCLHWELGRMALGRQWGPAGMGPPLLPCLLSPRLLTSVCRPACSVGGLQTKVPFRARPHRPSMRWQTRRAARSKATTWGPP